MSVWQTTAPMWLWQHSCEDESRKLTDGISDLFVFRCDFFCRTKMLMMIYRVRSFLRSPPSRMNTAWCKRSTRSSVLLTGEQGVWERCDTRAQPRPRGDVSVTTVTRHTRARNIAKPDRCVRGLLVLLPYPPWILHPPSKCHHPSLPPSSALLITPCHFP